jgi:GT2 family glycosyltransferase
MKPKVLFCITVYNGKEFVPRAIKSAVEMNQSKADVSVLILDDASPEPGWSEELEKICGQLGAIYYRTPRNLGIPRNVNLGLLSCLKFDFDFVFINNSDVIFPKNLVNQMLKAGNVPNVAATTAWSNNVSIYSLPNSDPDHHIANQDTVDWISETLAESYPETLLDIPAGISFCIMMSRAMVESVGLTDPCFGRGYCEETDWSLRALSRGHRMCLAPGAFVYHQGRGSNLSAGLVTMGATTVPKNEAIIDMRYPEFRKQVDRFIHSGKIQSLQKDAARKIVLKSIVEKGYVLELSDIQFDGGGKNEIVVSVSPSALRSAKVSYKGFQATFEMGSGNLNSALVKEFGDIPKRIEIRDSLPPGFGDMFPNVPQELKFRYATRV